MGVFSDPVKGWKEGIKDENDLIEILGIRGDYEDVLQELRFSKFWGLLVSLKQSLHYHYYLRKRVGVGRGNALVPHHCLESLDVGLRLNIILGANGFHPVADELDCLLNPVLIVVEQRKKGLYEVGCASFKGVGGTHCGGFIFDVPEVLSD